MQQARSTFLKTAGLAGGAALAGMSLDAQRSDLRAQGPAAGGERRDLAKAMTFCSLERGAGTGLGLRTERGILDVVAAEQALQENAPTSISAAFAGTNDLGGLKRLAERATAAHFIAEDKAKFAPCVTHPEKIVCIGLNDRKHAAETGQPVPTQPILFNKYNTALNACGGLIAVSKEKAEKFDYEAELVIVIGRTARNVAEAEALNYIFGYCTGNDFTARDLQSRSSQWMLGKTLDGSGPIGPWLVTADQVNGDNLKIECRVNGELRQSSNTSDMVFNCKQLVSYISHHMTLKPGDIIFTGTPEGVISGYPKDKQVWLKPGDKLSTSIEKLGELTFTLT